jgi:hypothetical protein
VAHQDEGRSRAPPLEPGDEVLTLRELADELTRDAVHGKVVPEDDGARGLVAGRIGGVDAQDGGEQLEHLALQRLPVLGAQSIAAHGRRPPERVAPR